MKYCWDTIERLYYKKAKRTEITLIIRDAEMHPLNTGQAVKGARGMPWH